MRWALALALLAGCAGRGSELLTAEDVTRGPAKLVVHAPDTVKVYRAWETEVMLRGRPRAYPHRLYLLIFSMEENVQRFSVAPSVQRYYRFDMQPFTPPFHPRDGVTVLTISLHELRGFNFMGEAQAGPPWLYHIQAVRYTYNLEAKMSLPQRTRRD